MHDYPAVLGHFELLLPLGRGGVAEVLLARQDGAPPGTEFVLKRLRPRVVRDRNVREMFEREAAIGREVRHAGLPRTLGFGELDGCPTLALPFVFGADLTRIAKRRTGGEPALDPLHALIVIRDAARALHALHEAGWVHRDVSPANLMVGYDGTTHVIDLGIATRTGERTGSDRTPEGKFAYMSPEQARGDGMDARSDLFSLGVVLYEFTTRRRLFRRDDPDDVLAAVRAGEVERPRVLDPSYPLDVEAIALHALALDPDDRFPDAASFADALDDAIAARGGLLDAGAVGRRLRSASAQNLAVLEDVTRPGYRGPAGAPTSVSLPAASPIRPSPPTASPPEDAVSASNDDDAPVATDDATPPAQGDELDGPPRGTVKADHDLGDSASVAAAASTGDDDELPPLREGRGIYRAIGVVMIALLAFVGYLVITQGVDTRIGDGVEPAPSIADFDAEPLAAPEPPPVVTGEISSEPTGAWIVINGVATRQQTPAEIELVEGRPNTISLHHDGYGTVRLLADGEDGVGITATLDELGPPPEPEPQPETEPPADAAAPADAGAEDAGPEVPPGYGRIRVIAVDVGRERIEAEVLLNGERVPGVTPLELVVRANIEQHITVRRGGFRDSVTYTSAIPFRDIRSEREVTLEMTRAQEGVRGATTVRVTATPEQAALAVDGEDQGRLNVLTLDSPGHYVIEVSADDHEPLVQTVDARLGQFEFRPVLWPLRTGASRLNLRVEPAEALIFGERLRNASSGATQLGTGSFDGEIEAGPWQLTFEHRGENGRQRGRVEVEIEPGMARTLVYRLDELGLENVTDESETYEAETP